MATREKLCKMPFQPGGVSELSTHEAGNSATIGISELEQILKHKTFTRSETQHLITLLLTRTIEVSPSDNFLAAILSSKVVEERIASSSPELANANIGSCIGQPPKTSLASPQHPTTIENLPDELLSNIFIHLLAKQLAQMRSVSKSCNALLSQSSFIKSHLHRSINSSHQTLFHFNNPKPCVAFEVLLCQSPHLQLPNSIKLPPKRRLPLHYSLRVIGAVNGLICSSYTDSVIHIWNPSLSSMITLPPYSMPSVGYEWIKVFFRFGFDPKTDDYKVVKLTAFADPEDSAVVISWMDVEIYSMRKGCWELITKKFPSHITWIEENDVVCADAHDGHLHWLCCTNEEECPYTIMAFDLGLETFHEIPLPHLILVYKYHRLNSLGVFGGQLCVMSSVRYGGACEVWVMEEYGVAESWVKRHVITHFLGDTYPFGFTSANKFLIQDHHCRLVLYDPVTEEAQILKNDCEYEEYCAGKIVEYVDSLEWVAPAKPETLEGGRQN